jgi:hypothetical protein
MDESEAQVRFLRIVDESHYKKLTKTISSKAF